MLLESGPHGLLVLLLLSKKPSRSTSTSEINAWLIGWARWMWRNGSATSGRTTCPTGGIVVGAWNLQGLTVRIDGRMQIARPMSSPLTWWAPIQLAEMMVETEMEVHHSCHWPSTSSGIWGETRGCEWRRAQAGWFSCRRWFGAAGWRPTWRSMRGNQTLAEEGSPRCSFWSMVMGTRPTMTNGWVLREGKKVQHARAVVCPAAAGEKAVMELYDATTRRITGKQPSTRRTEQFQHQCSTMIFLISFETTLTPWWLSWCFGGSWPLKIGGRMWRVWHTPDGPPLDEAVADEPYSPTSLFKCDECGLLQPKLGSCDFCGDRGTSSTPLNSILTVGLAWSTCSVFNSTWHFYCKDEVISLRMTCRARMGHWRRFLQLLMWSWRKHHELWRLTWSVGMDLWAWK